MDTKPKGWPIAIWQVTEPQWLVSSAIHGWLADVRKWIRNRGHLWPVCSLHGRTCSCLHGWKHPRLSLPSSGHAAGLRAARRPGPVPPGVPLDGLRSACRADAQPRRAIQSRAGQTWELTTTARTGLTRDKPVKRSFLTP